MSTSLRDRIEYLVGLGDPQGSGRVYSVARFGVGPIGVLNNE